MTAHEITELLNGEYNGIRTTALEVGAIIANANDPARLGMWNPRVVAVVLAMATGEAEYRMTLDDLDYTGWVIRHGDEWHRARLAEVVAGLPGGDVRRHAAMREHEQVIDYVGRVARGAVAHGDAIRARAFADRMKSLDVEYCEAFELIEDL